MGKNMSLLVVVAAIALAMGGCTVMGSTYTKKVNEADNNARELAALQQKYETLSAENSAVKARVVGLTTDLVKTTGERNKVVTDNKALESENARLKQDLAALRKAQEENVQKVSKTYEDLLVKMKGEIAKGQMTISELKGKLTVNMVDAVLFDSGKAEVKAGGQAILQKIVSILKDVKDKSIRIEGHTDNVPIIGMLAKKYPTNRELSAARALNVTRYLQEQGIDPAHLSAIAYGEYKPVAGNDTPEGKAKNRRIEIILVPKE
ncbi:MAG: chemotaxis protein MotB [Deltaproteobacteria bacterium RBG_16_64_85]|nr:MAG: chemotaxis protein MotB [Deltaproteobacteria bacterium RBG_16_64_85]